MSETTPVIGKEFTVPPELSERVIRGNITVGEFLGLSKSVQYALASMAQNLAEAGKMEDALGIFKGLVAASPYDSVFHANLATLYAKQEKVDLAIESYENSLRYNLANVDALAGLGEMYLSKGDVLKAVEKLKLAVEKDPQGQKGSGRRAAALLLMLKEQVEKQKAGATRKK